MQKEITIDDIFALFRESEEETKKRQAEAEKRQAEAEKRQAEAEKRQAEFDARHAKFQEEMDRSFKRLNRELGRLGNTFGDWAEDFFSKKILDNFKALGFTFDQNSRRVTFKHPDEKHPFAEVDFWLENGDYVMAVEVKSNFKSQYMERTLERLEEVGAHLRKKGDKRKLLGGIAGMTLEDGVRKNALKNGLFVITQSGESADITAPIEPKAW